MTNTTTKITTTEMHVALNGFDRAVDRVVAWLTAHVINHLLGAGVAND